MLEHVPEWLGRAMRPLRAGADKLCIAQPELGTGFAAIRLASPAFADGAPMPPRFTADGEGVSPPLYWNEVPEGTAGLALVVEDPDAPSPQPLVHAIVWDIAADASSLPEGAIKADSEAVSGRNSYFQQGWLPPDPPTGHGPHAYAFQLFALSEVPSLGDSPGRSALMTAMEGRLLAAGLLTGTYSRGEPVRIEASSGAPAPA